MYLMCYYCFVTVTVMPSNHSSMSPVHEDSSLQVVPNLPSFNSSAHSYSSRQPQKLQTFSADNDKCSPKFHDKNFNNSNSVNYSLHENAGLNTTADHRRFNDGFVHASPAKVIPVTPIGKSVPTPRHKDFHQHHNPHVRQSDDSGTESELSEVQYSCVDMSDILQGKSPRLGVIVDDDDQATTTSGSYVVDPEDLCDEIDDLFFRS